MFAMFNGWPVTRATIRVPRTGAVQAEIEALVNVGEDAGASGYLLFGSQEYSVAVKAGGLYKSTWRGRLVTGKGNLNKALAPNYFNGASGLAILNDALDAAGESLSSSSDTVALQELVPLWARTSQTLGGEIRAIAQRFALDWRVLENGEVWLGKYSNLPYSGEYMEVDFCPLFGNMEIKLTKQNLLPGMVLQGKTVSHLIHRLVDDKVTTEVYFEDA